MERGGKSESREAIVMTQATDDRVIYQGDSASREKRADVGLFLNSSKWK